MSERQVVIDWLAQVARRLRWNQSIAVLASVTFWLLALVLVWQVIRAVVPVEAVVSALMPLLILAAVAVAGWAVFKAWRRPSLADAAFAADRIGGWQDQLKSALWFASASSASHARERAAPDDVREQAGVSVLMARARSTVAACDPRVLLPLRATPMLYGAVGIAALSALMTWWSPRIAYSDRLDPAGASARALGAKPHAAQASAGNGGAEEQAGGQARVAAVGRGGPGSQGDAATSASADPAAAARPGALDEGGAPPPATLTEPGAQRAADIGGERRAGRNAPQETPSEWLGSVVERLKELLQQGDLDSTGDSVRPEGDAQGEAVVNRSDRGNQQDLAESDPSTQMRNADNSGGSQLNLNALGGIGPRNTVPGDVAGEEQSGRNNNSNSGPLGRRVSTSRGGPGDEGDAPKGDPGGNSESPAILGRKTVRLALQLRRVPSPAKSAADELEVEAGTPEEFFAATRAQAARVAATPGAELTRGAAAEALSTEQTPLAYRAAVKDYFLTQHRKEK